MQNNRFSHARRIFLGLGAALSLMFVGCQSTAITNLTPSALPENPSQIYTISARIVPRDSGFVYGTLVPQVVVDGRSYVLQKSSLGEDIYELDYQVPAGRTEIAYYFVINYQIRTGGGLVAPREDYTPIQRLQVANRYVLSLEANRGPVGSRVSILGRGFTPNDVVYFDETPTRTVFESANALSFYVPGIDANRNYRVSVSGASGRSQVGTFRIDGPAGAEPTSTGFTAPNAGALMVTPNSLSLKPGEKTTMTFTSPVTATAGGLLIDVTTDVPQSVIMPEVIIPSGSNTVSITVEGGRPGTGNLYLKGPGVKELSVPVTVGK